MVTKETEDGFKYTAAILPDCVTLIRGEKNLCNSIAEDVFVLSGEDATVEIVGADNIIALQKFLNEFVDSLNEKAEIPDDVNYKEGISLEEIESLTKKLKI